MGIRTPDLLNAIEALYQLSYDPLSEGKLEHVVGALATPFAVRVQRRLKLTGTSTVLAAATPRTMRGVNFQRLTAVSAAWSRMP